jgi:glycerophosphoryl diester phosphodiesterase
MESLGTDAFNCSGSYFKKKWLADVELNNIPVNIYTVNDARNMKRFINMGVSGIFTNNPDILKRVAADIKQMQKSESQE